MKRIITILLFSTLFLSGCTSAPANSTITDSAQTSTELPSNSTALEAPFTDVTWETTDEELKAKLGTDYEAYDSVYGGITYSYKAEYDDFSGVVKYMYDDKKELKCVALALSFEDAKSQSAAYEKLHSELVEEYGESGFNSKNYTSQGDVWYRENGDILISAMTTNTQKAVQYSYLHPSVSHESAGK